VAAAVCGRRKQALTGWKPHRSQNFKLSRGKHFVWKSTDVAGWYLRPLDKVQVLSVAEKARSKALNR
jgi:hypothetical protein